MSPAAKSVTAIAVGLAALVFLMLAEVRGWPLSPLSCGLLGSLIGFVPGYLAPSPRSTSSRTRLGDPGCVNLEALAAVAALSWVAILAACALTVQILR